MIMIIMTMMMMMIISLQFTLQKQLQAIMLRQGDSKFDDMGKDKDSLRWVFSTIKRMDNDNIISIDLPNTFCVAVQ